MPSVARDVPCARRRVLLTFKQRRRNLARLPARIAVSPRRILMRNVRAVALVLLAGMLAAACGARLPSSERRQAAAAILNAGSGSVGKNPAAPGSSTDPPVPGGGPGTIANGPVTGPGAGGNGPATSGQQG